ncbi:hypothetical protein GRX03_04920 [Halovenus sp. WSH3]|uniref:Uncharacterized protein n=1 Tax=Halovenus carboxidivorans TaxID=2692199 RepID=A0A6B0T7T2_9EURY|nr:hypothetical protein [Halovenus carboxidivorans]MXR50950.1 hypothetical protein [Halovenus carboxidivorans]
MSESSPDWSRRQILQYGGVGAALAVAGCNSPGSSTGDGSEQQPGSLAAQFELAGNGAEGFRPWLDPAFTIDPQTEGRRRQLYQFIDYDLIPRQGMEEQKQRRAAYAERIGIAPESVNRELLLGPVEGALPYRALFGSFDSTTLVQSFENSDFQRTAEPGEFVVFDDTFAISDEAIIEHPSVVDLIQGRQEEKPPFEGIDEEMEILLDLVPAGPQVTINSRDDLDDVVVDGLTIIRLNGSVATYSMRTLVFEDESAATSERVRELDIENSARNEVLTEEIHGRVAMIESQRSG